MFLPVIYHRVWLIYLGKDSDQFSDVTDNVTSDGTLVISKVTKKHEGYYMCEANNDVGTPISSIICLNVQGKQFYNIIVLFIKLL